MKRICLLIGVAALCGCGRRIDRTPLMPIDSAPPLRTAVTPAPPAVDPATLNSSRGNVDATPPAGYDGAGAGDGAGEGTPRRSQSEAISTINGQLEDVFFGYDHFDLSPEASAAVRHDADLLRAILRDFPGLQITVEGHCDERGSAEYNLGLGDRRATRAVAALIQFGLPQANFAPVSYGKERPQCTEANESCWGRNRRAHFVVRTTPTE